MKKVFFAAITITSFACASDSPPQSPRHIKTNVSGSLKKNEQKRIDIDQVINATKLSKSTDNPHISRVRRQSFGSHEDFIKNDLFAKQENITEATFRRDRSESK